jgi:hypothetical protein
MLIGAGLWDTLPDQLYTWSDEYTHGTGCYTSQTPQRPCPSATAPSIDSSWLSNRAIQAMRQAWMQMCRWFRTWTQVLSVGELSGLAATDGLRTPGGLRGSFGVTRQLSANARDSGRDLRDQPRVAASSRGALTRLHDPVASHPSCTDRRGGWRGSSGQYAGMLARRKPGEFIFCGGHR